MFNTEIKDFIDDESGQGITEYGAMLAFVGLLVAMVFSAGHSTIASAIQNTYSTVNHSMNQLAANSS